MEKYNLPERADPQPKRRRDTDNPYEIFTVGSGTPYPHYYLAFRDSEGVTQTIEIDKALYDAFERFELDDLSFFNEVDRHHEQSAQTEEALHRRAIQPQDSVEEVVSRRMETEALHQAIARLPEKQRRRLMLYYFGEFTYGQIAEMEGCTFQAVAKSVAAAGNEGSRQRSCRG